MNLDQIFKLLPHRYPFLLVDRILELNKEEKPAVGLKNLSINEHFFQGHFPSEPVFPGVLLIESLAQISSILFFKLLEQEGSAIYLAKIEEARFIGKAVPGDTIYLYTHQIIYRKGVVFFETHAKVDGKIIAQAKIVASVNNCLLNTDIDD